MKAQKKAATLGPTSGIVGFLRLVSGKDLEPGDAWVFRGHREATWDLTPKIDRPEFVAYRNRKRWSRDEHERWLLKEFMKIARPHVVIAPESQWEWLAIAQHHGLATRLLDWTGNPLAGLFFAVEEQGSRESAVWCYHHVGKSSVSAPDPYSIDAVVAYFPPHVTPRITVQGGSFTSHPAINDDDSGSWKGELRKIIVDGQSRERLRNQLANVGVTRASLFPDLDGAATHVNWRYSQHEIRTRTRKSERSGR